MKFTLNNYFVLFLLLTLCKAEEDEIKEIEPVKETIEPLSEPAEGAARLMGGVSEAGKVAAIVAGDAFDGLKALARSQFQKALSGEPMMFSGGNGDYADYEGGSYGGHGRVQARQEGGILGLLHTYFPFLRMDERQLGSIALNILVYVGQMFARKFLGGAVGDTDVSEYRSIVREEGFLGGLEALVIRSQESSEALKKAALDKSLPEEIIGGLRNKTGSGSACVQLFICKMSPLIWGVQDSASKFSLDFRHSLSNNANYWIRSIPNFLPDMERVSSFGRQECEKKFPDCPLVDFEQIMGTEDNKMEQEDNVNVEES